MKSRVFEFIGIVRGFVTKIRYTCAIIFVDQHSGIFYIDLQYSFTVKDTIKAKATFEAYTRSHGLSIKRYHADNRRVIN